MKKKLVIRNMLNDTYLTLVEDGYWTPNIKYAYLFDSDDCIDLVIENYNNNNNNIFDDVNYIEVVTIYSR